MNTVRIYPLTHLSTTQVQRLRDAQREAAQVWNFCMQIHKDARLQHTSWPGRNELQRATKGRFALHSQSLQMVVHAFLANIDTTRQLRHTHPQMQMRYPYKEKQFYPVMWPEQAVSCFQWDEGVSRWYFPLTCQKTVVHVHSCGITAMNCMCVWRLSNKRLHLGTNTQPLISAKSISPPQPPTQARP